MRWRLIQFIVLFLVFVVFIVLNLGEEYRCKINFGFIQTKEVPVFLTVFFSFIIGMLCILPFVFIKPHKKQDNEGQKGFFAKKNRSKGNDSDAQPEDTGISNSKIYGID